MTYVPHVVVWLCVEDGDRLESRLVTWFCRRIYGRDFIGLLQGFRVNYYHGGRGGMRRGQYVLPPSLTGAKSSAHFGNYMCDPGRVYVSTNPLDALMYAAAVNGDVYEVAPEGDLLDDLDCKERGVSASCTRARITKVVKFSRSDHQLALAVILDSARSYLIRGSRL